MVPDLTCDHRPNTAAGAADGPRLEEPKTCDATRYSSLAGPLLYKFKLYHRRARLSLRARADYMREQTDFGDCPADACAVGWQSVNVHPLFQLTAPTSAYLETTANPKRFIRR